jgi:hypothetical protein
VSIIQSFGTVPLIPLAYHLSHPVLDTQTLTLALSPSPDEMIMMMVIAV